MPPACPLSAMPYLSPVTSAQPGEKSDFDFLRDFDRVIDLNAVITHSALASSAQMPDLRSKSLSDRAD